MFESSDMTDPFALLPSDMSGPLATVGGSSDMIDPFALLPYDSNMSDPLPQMEAATWVPPSAYTMTY